MGKKASADNLESANKSSRAEAGQAPEGGYRALPGDRKQLAALQTRLLHAESQVEELGNSIYKLAQQIRALHQLSSDTGEAARQRRESRQLVIDAVRDKIVQLLADSPEHTVDEAMTYAAFPENAYSAICAVLWEYQPINHYDPEALREADLLVQALRNRYHPGLQNLRMRVEEQLERLDTDSVRSALPHICIVVGDNPYKVKENPQPSSLEYGRTGSASRKWILLDFEDAVILKILYEAPPPGVMSAENVMAEARERFGVTIDVRWSRIRPAFNNRLPPDLKGLMGGIDKKPAFFDGSILAKACQKLA